ncbi:hypothetical protein ACFLQN_00655 [Candidatus Aenigmatarchaeota archaeon]
MKTQQILAVLIAIVAVSGVGFAAMPQHKVDPQQYTDAADILSVLGVEVNEDDTRPMRDIALYDEEKPASRIYPYYPYPQYQNEDLYPNVIVFKGVAVKDTVEPAAFIAFQRTYPAAEYTTTNSLVPHYEPLYNYNYLIINGELIELTHKDTDFDWRTQTLVVTFRDEAGKEATLVVKFYRIAGRTVMFMSGEYDGYTFNMERIPYRGLTTLIEILQSYDYNYEEPYPKPIPMPYPAEPDYDQPDYGHYRGLGPLPMEQTQVNEILEMFENR